MNLIKKNSGFSLVELLVATSIFIGVLAIIAGTFSSFVGKQRQQLGQQLLQQETQNFFDVIDREIRTSYGETYNASGTSDFRLKNQEQKYATGAQAESRYVLRTESDGSKRIYYREAFSGNMLPLSSDQVDVKELNFIWSKPNEDVAGGFLYGVGARLTVTIKACVKADQNSCLHTQTTISSRQLKPLDAP